MNHLALALLGVTASGCGSGRSAASSPDDAAVPESAGIVATSSPGNTATLQPTPKPAATTAATLQAMPAEAPRPPSPPPVAPLPTKPPAPGIASPNTPAPLPLVTQVCAAPKRTCCCAAGDLLCAMMCGVWNQAAPAGMLGSCLGQCRAGKANACLRAALSFEQGVGVAPDPKRAQELRARTCKLDSFIGGSGCTSAGDPTAR